MEAVFQHIADLLSRMGHTGGGDAITSQVIVVALLLLTVASVVAMVVRFVRIPYTLALVIAGLLLSALPATPPVDLTPELVLFIFLPALLFEASWNMQLSQLRKNLLPILLLSMLGLVGSVFIIGLTLNRFGGLELLTALLFGAIISATDPVAVLGLFKRLNLPERLAVLIEGESLFNDGGAAVLFMIILTLVTGTGMAGHTVGGILVTGVEEFFLVVGGGIALGLVIGVVMNFIMARFDHHLLEVLLSILAAYGSFVLAEHIHFSPVFAVLAAGLVMGNYGRESAMSPTTQVSIDNFWELAGYIVNSMIFLLLGLQVNLSDLLASGELVALGVGAILVARVLAVYPLMGASGLLGNQIPFKWQHLQVWGGLRGALSVALALSIPMSVAARSTLIELTFGTVLFTLLVQGLTISPLLKWLDLGGDLPGMEEYRKLRGEITVLTEALQELERMDRENLVSETVYQEKQRELKELISAREEEIDELQLSAEQLRAFERERIEHDLAAVQKAKARQLVRRGELSEESFNEIISRVNSQLLETEREALEVEERAVEDATKTVEEDESTESST